jgi:uridine phosphorylase
MWERSTSAGRIGFIGCAVGGSFAVLIAEQLFASGCEVLVSIASAGQIADTEMPSQTILIERALRDEGTSYHYLPPAPFVSVEESLAQLAERAFAGTGQPVLRGTTWTTDAPFRETSEAIAARRSEGVLAVEMEAASLYAFGAACGYPVLCLAQVTNQLGCIEGDFEKGEHDGASGSLALIDAFAAAWRAQHSSDALAALRSKRS